MKIFKIIFFFIIALFAHAATATAGEKLSEPNVLVGVHINGIRNISFKADSFVLDATIWFSWKDQSLHPHKTFKLLNAKIDSKRVSTDIYIPEKNIRYASVEVIATIDKKWDIKKFPFDQQTLHLQMEEDDMEYDKILYGVDKENTTTNTKLEVHGWNVSTQNSYISENIYDTNFGNPRIPEDDVHHATEFNHEITIERASLSTGIKLLVAPLVAIFLINAILRLPPTEAARMTVMTAALFALVSANYLVANMLPDSDGFSYAEKLICLGLIECGLYFIETVSALRLIKMGNDDMAKTIEKRLSILLGIVNLTFILYTIFIFFI